MTTECKECGTLRGVTFPTCVCELIRVAPPAPPGLVRTVDPESFEEWFQKEIGIDMDVCGDILKGCIEQKFNEVFLGMPHSWTRLSKSPLQIIKDLWQSTRAVTVDHKATPSAERKSGRSYTTRKPVKTTGYPYGCSLE